MKGSNPPPTQSIDLSIYTFLRFIWLTHYLKYVMRILHAKKKLNRKGKGGPWIPYPIFHLSSVVPSSRLTYPIREQLRTYMGTAGDQLPRLLRSFPALLSSDRARHSYCDSALHFCFLQTKPYCMHIQTLVPGFQESIASTEIKLLEEKNCS